MAEVLTAQSAFLDFLFQAGYKSLNLSETLGGAREGDRRTYFYLIGKDGSSEYQLSDREESFVFDCDGELLDP